MNLDALIIAAALLKKQVPGLVVPPVVPPTEPAGPPKPDPAAAFHVGQVVEYAAVGIWSLAKLGTILSVGSRTAYGTFYNITPHPLGPGITIEQSWIRAYSGPLPT